MSQKQPESLAKSSSFNCPLLERRAIRRSYFEGGVPWLLPGIENSDDKVAVLRFSTNADYFQITDDNIHERGQHVKKNKRRVTPGPMDDKPT